MEKHTKVVCMTEENMDGKLLQEAGKIIKNGGLVAFPTETVYGLGGDALNAVSSARIYEAKGRPSDNPLIVHISRWEDVFRIAEQVPETAKQLAEAFWPGPLTMILQKASCVPPATTGGLDTVAVRMPDHKVALEFIRAAGGFVAAPSANLSGRPSPTMAKYVVEDMSGRIDMIIDGGSVGLGLESTIVDLTGKIPMILRPGYITSEMLREVLGEVCTDPAVLERDTMSVPRAPGMKYRHYAPKGELYILKGIQASVVDEINRRAEQMSARGEKVGIIATEGTVSLYRAHSVKSAGAREDEKNIARALYRLLREFDEEGVTVIYSEALAEEKEGLGLAVRNRLLKAAGYRIEEV